METIGLYFELGWKHVLDVSALDHLFFISAFTLPFNFRDLKKLLLWTTLFTVGHTLSLVGNYYFALHPSETWIEFLIPLSILVACLPLLRDSSQGDSEGFMGALIFLFGIVHGFGFSRYFGMIVPEDSATQALFSFAFGVEGAQIVIILGVLILEFLVVRILGLSKSKWRVIGGAMIASQALEMTLNNLPI